MTSSRCGLPSAADGPLASPELVRPPRPKSRPGHTAAARRIALVAAWRVPGAGFRAAARPRRCCPMLADLALGGLAVRDLGFRFADQLANWHSGDLVSAVRNPLGPAARRPRPGVWRPGLQRHDQLYELAGGRPAAIDQAAADSGGGHRSDGGDSGRRRASVGYLAAVARFADDLVSRGRVLPALDVGGRRVRGPLAAGAVGRADSAQRAREASPAAIRGRLPPRRMTPRPARCWRACSTRWPTRWRAPGCRGLCCPRGAVAAPPKFPFIDNGPWRLSPSPIP